jgi:hypothetical protein
MDIDDRIEAVLEEFSFSYPYPQFYGLTPVERFRLQRVMSQLSAWAERENAKRLDDVWPI